MKDIILINPPLTMHERYGKLSGAGNNMASLGLCCLAAVCRQNEFSVEIIEASSNFLTHDAVVEKIIKDPPRFVGITATTSAIHSAAKLASSIKKQCPQITTLIGGAHVTAIPEKTMRFCDSFDIGIIGEGEETIIEVLKNPMAIRHIPGVIFRDNRREVQQNTVRNFISNLDSLPIPAWDLLPQFPHNYSPPAFRYKNLPAAYLVTSRGCPMKCTFCDRSVFGNKHRFFSASYVYTEMKHLSINFKIREILFEDDSFTANRPRLIELCQMLIREPLGITWSCLGRVDRIDKEALLLMKKAGCWQIGFGIESGNERILGLMEKKIRPEQIRDALHLTRQCGIKTKGFFIIGFPTEDQASVGQSISFAKSLALNDITVSVFTPFPGSGVYENASQYGEFVDDWGKMNLLEPVFVPNGFSKKELVRYSKKFLRSFYFRPRVVFDYCFRIVRNPAAAGKMLRGFFSFLTTM